MNMLLTRLVRGEAASPQGLGDPDGGGLEAGAGLRVQAGGRYCKQSERVTTVSLGPPGNSLSMTTTQPSCTSHDHHDNEHTPKRRTQQ